MKIVANKDFKEQLPDELLNINNNICCRMDYPYIIQFKDYEYELAFLTGFALGYNSNQIANNFIDGFSYIGLYK